MPEALKAPLLALATILIVALLSGCVDVVNPIAPEARAEAVACAGALASAGVGGPEAMAVMALASPACRGLAQDVVQWAVREAMLQAALRR